MASLATIKYSITEKHMVEKDSAGKEIARNGTNEKDIAVKDIVEKFQEYLKKYEKDDGLVIDKAETKVGSNFGDNYMSILIRVKLTGRRGDGNPYNKTLMWKKFSDEPAIFEKVDLDVFFCQEKQVYQKILSVLGRFAPKCLHADERNIIMEDLAQKRYVLCERRNFLDLKHTVYALKTMAKFHASALSVKIQNTRLFNEWISSLREVIYIDDSLDSKMRSCTNKAIETTISYLEMVEPRTRELEVVMEYLKTYVNAYDRLHALFNAPKHKYHTICHGDPWTNNLLFLHDDEGEIIDLKMVDYQICRHNSVASDVLYFIYTSVHMSLIEKSYESLIRIYHDEFIGELDRLQVSKEILTELSMEWLSNELQMFSFYGANTGCYFINLVFAEKEDALRFKAGASHMCETSMKDEKKFNRVKCILLHHYRRYVLGVVEEDLEPIP